jgi:hypothetical protein
MSDESEEATQDGHPFPINPNTSDEADWFLQELVAFTNRTGFEVGVTLVVGGIMVSGMMIGGRKYFEQFADIIKHSLTQAIDAEFGEMMGNSYATVAEIYKPVGDGEVEPSAITKPGYIHMKDAVLYHPNDSPRLVVNHALWRVRITAVDAFTLGTPSV